MAPQPQPSIQSGKAKLSKRTRFLLMLVQIGILGTIVYFAPPWKHWAMWTSALGWIGFMQYWSAASRNSAEAKSSESTTSRRVHEVLLNAAYLLLFIPVPGLRQSFLPASAAWAPIGLAVQASAIALAVWARRHLGRNWSAKIEIKIDHELVRTGPYRLLRHPIYSAVIGMCVGTAIVSGELHALVGVALSLAAYARKIHMEEAKLREAFGPQYEDYRRKTWALIAGVY